MLQEIEGVGDVVAKSVYDWFRLPSNVKLLDKLIKEITIEFPKTKPSSGKLSNKSFVLTGTLSTMSRDEAKEKIRSLGGIVSSSISKNTEYVVAGSNAGSKHKRAKELGVKILDEKQFKQILK
jgi:DNA ligase (NAD+)